MNEHISPDGLYRQGLHHFNNGAWQDAIDAFSRLQASGQTYPGVAELMADARLKLQIESAEAPAFMPPPRTRKMPRVLLTALVCLLIAAAFPAYSLVRSVPAPTAAAADALAAPMPSTAAPESTPLPTPAPSAAPTAVPVIAGSVDIRPADELTFVSAPANVEIILDASGSMQAELGPGKSRWQGAQEALGGLIGSGAIAEQSNLALRVYGHRTGSDCGDIELVQPLAPFHGDELVNTIGALKPAYKGMTPLAASLDAAAADLSGAEGNSVVILVTDGLETCDGDPVAAAANFVRDHPQRKVHVIGFATGSQEVSDQLRQIAVSGNGLYFDAADSAGLGAALRQTIEVHYQLLAEDGTEVQAGTIGQPPAELQPGNYTLKIEADPPLKQKLVIEDGTRLEVRIRHGYGGLIADVKDVTPEAP